MVEAKRTRRDPREGQQQAKLYADCLEQQFGRRPVIFYSNGYDTWLWDSLQYPPRPVQGFYKKEELEFLIEEAGSDGHEDGTLHAGGHKGGDPHEVEVRRVVAHALGAAR